MREEQTLPLGVKPMDVTTAQEAPAKIDWRAIAETMVRSAYFWPTLILALGIGIVFWPLLSYLPDLWTGKDGYYTHGFLVPLISGYLIYRAWPKLKTIEIKGQMWALVLLVPLLWIAYAARLAQLRPLQSAAFIGTLLVCVWAVFGIRWALRTVPAALYLLFALPIWSGIVNNYTNPLQLYSTKVAFKMLQLFYDPIQSNSTTVLVGRFWLDVGVPCSGLKLVLAITAFTCFFMLIGNLRWWSNLIMVACILPLCLFINGLRIAMIGMVGEAYGDNAGHVFHDYSGYIALIVCFFLLFKLARILGWKG